MATTPVQHADVSVDLTAIRDNVAALQAHAPSAQVMAVVKADAYGHGLLPSALAAQAGGATWLGTAVLPEALALRRAGVGGRVLCWLAAPGEQWQLAIGAEVDVTASATWALAEIVAAAKALGRPARLHLKIDTGLGRNGCPPADWPELVEAALAAQADGAVQIVGLMSHFAYADAPGHPTVKAQDELFAELTGYAYEQGVRAEVRHLANSAATLTSPQSHYDLVRPGIAVYGLSPVPDVASAAELGLRPAMRVSARLAGVKRLPAGHGVSYGHTYLTPRETTVGLVPLGYADGIPRAASGTGPVLAAGRVRQVAGRVCMDQVVVDLEDDAAAVGDEVVLVGDPGRGEPTAQQWAEAAGTISYEIVTRMAPRLPRRYVGAAELGLDLAAAE